MNAPRPVKWTTGSTAYAFKKIRKVNRCAENGKAGEKAMVNNDMIKRKSQSESKYTIPRRRNNQQRSIKSSKGAPITTLNVKTQTK